MIVFLEVMGPGPSKVTLNVSRIVSIRATSSGCTIRLTEGDSVSVRTPYREIKKAIEEASSAHIHSIVSDDQRDATPPPEITVS
jgi:hypothetical protein